MAEKKKTYKFPKSMGLCADQLYATREKRLKAQKIVDEIDAEEKALKAFIIDNLPRSQQTGASGKVANVRIVDKEIPQIADLDAFYTYLRRTKRNDLLQKRLNEGAVLEIIDSGKTVPGINMFNVKTVSLTKAK